MLLMYAWGAGARARTPSRWLVGEVHVRIPKANTYMQQGRACLAPVNVLTCRLALHVVVRLCNGKLQGTGLLQCL